MPTPSTPIITLTSSNTEAQTFIAINNGATKPSYNDVYRYFSMESPSQAKRIATAVIPDSGFTDKTAPSGMAVFYFVRAIAADSSFADSAASSTTLNLLDMFINAVTRNSSATNSIGPTVTAWNTGPQVLTLSRRIDEYEFSGASSPDLQGSNISQKVLRVVIRLLTKQRLLDLRTLRDLKITLCFRDQNGAVVFGTIANYSETYQVGYNEIELTVEENDFNISAGTHFHNFAIQQSGALIITQSGFPISLN